MSPTLTGRTARTSIPEGRPLMWGGFQGNVSGIIVDRDTDRGVEFELSHDNYAFVATL